MTQGKIRYDKHGGVDIIAALPEPSSSAGKWLLYRTRHQESFSLYNCTEDWHSYQHTNSTGVRFIEKFI